MNELPNLSFKDDLPELTFEEKLPSLDFDLKGMFGGGSARPSTSDERSRSFAPTLGEKIENWSEKFIGDHPNIYGTYGAIKEFTKFGHLKYFYPEEREKLSKLPPQKQTRQLLVDTLEDVGALGVNKILKGLGNIAGPAFERFTPRLHQFLTKPRTLTSDKKYKQLLQEIADTDLSIAGKSEPKTLQLIRREPETYLSPKPKSAEELGATIIKREEPAISKLIKDAPKHYKKKDPAEAFEKIQEFRKSKGLPPLKETSSAKLKEVKKTEMDLAEPPTKIIDDVKIDKTIASEQMPVAKKSKEMPTPKVERRKDPVTREYVREMVKQGKSEEIENIIFNDSLSGLESARGWFARPREKFQGMLDADGLKWFNENVSYAAGNVMLKTVGKALGKATKKSAREKGDEFFYESSTLKGMKRIEKEVDEYLQNNPFEITMPNGEKRLYRAKVTHGRGLTQEIAERRLHAAKKKRATKRGEETGRVDMGETRSFKDIAKDINKVLGERGSVSRKTKDLTIAQKKALARLMKDAERSGKKAEDFLRESGFSEKSVASLSKYIVPEKPLPTYAQSVNLEKQSVPDSAKRLEVEMSGKKKYQSWDTTDSLSDSILSNPEKWKGAFKKVKNLKGLTENMDAIRKINVNGIDRLAKMEREFATGNMSEVVFQREFQLMRDDIFKTLSDGSSEIGRALNAHKRIVGTTDELAKGLAKIEGKMSESQRKSFREAVKNMENPVAIQRFLNTIDDPTLKDYIIEYWYNSILSGPPTHAVNTISNTLWNLYQIGHRVPVAIIDKYYSTITGKERTRVINEVIPMLAGYKTGLKRGSKEAWGVLKTGEIQNMETKWAQEVGMSSVGAWARSPHPWMQKVAPFVSAPTRALRAMDVWFNSMAYDAEMMSIATRKGVLKKLKGSELKSFVDDFVKNPTDEASQQAMKMAKHSTFMDDPDPFTNWFLGIRRVPAIGTASRFIVPFVNTIGNLTKRGLEMTPGVGIAKEAISRKMGRGLGTPEIIAKQIEGAILTLYTLYKCDIGEITGPAPQNEAERERFYAEGKRPWSIKSKDTWISYRRIEPFNTVIASASIAYDKIKNAKDDDTRTKIFGQIASDFKNNLLDSSYFQGMQQVFNRYEKFEKAPQRTAASFVPYSSFWRSMNRAYEKATEGDVKVRDQKTWLGAFAQVIPGLSGKIPAKLNIWGEETINPGSILQHWLPYKWSKETQDPVERELARLNKALKKHPSGLKVYPGQPSQILIIGGNKTKLSDKVYRDYLIDLGYNLRNEYEKIIKDVRYLNYSDERKAKYLLSKTVSVRRKIRKKLEKKLNQ